MSDDVVRAGIGRRRQADEHHREAQRLAKWRATAGWVSAIANLVSAATIIAYALTHWK